MNRNTANWNARDGRFSRRFLNWTRNVVKNCPMMLSRFIAIVEAMLPFMKI